MRKAVFTTKMAQVTKAKPTARVDIDKIVDGVVQKAVAKAQAAVKTRPTRKGGDVTIADLNDPQRAVIAMAKQLQPVKPDRAPTAAEIGEAAGPASARDADSFLAVMRAQRKLLQDS
jgi:hypothetical protein